MGGGGAECQINHTQCARKILTTPQPRFKVDPVFSSWDRLSSLNFMWWRHTHNGGLPNTYTHSTYVPLARNLSTRTPSASARPTDFRQRLSCWRLYSWSHPSWACRTLPGGPKDSRRMAFIMRASSCWSPWTAPQTNCDYIWHKNFQNIHWKQRKQGTMHTKQA